MQKRTLQVHAFLRGIMPEHVRSNTSIFIDDDDRTFAVIDLALNKLIEIGVIVSEEEYSGSKLLLTVKYLRTVPHIKKIKQEESKIICLSK